MAHELLAKSDHQLGMCLRMLYAEEIGRAAVRFLFTARKTRRERWSFS